MKRLIFAMCLMLPLSLQAQTSPPAAPVPEERGFLEGLLEDNLSSAGRDVQIEGFSGALSSQATLEKLTIADDDGIWLTLTDVLLNWNRTALLSGRLEVTELSAGQLLMPRKPIPDTSLPSAEATPLALPSLPVSVKIDKLAIPHVVLGAPVLGQNAVLAVNGAAQLADGSGTLDLTVQRKQPRDGRITLRAAYAEQTQDLALSLSVNEPKDGLIATGIGIPGAPPIALSIIGQGPVSDFTADIALHSDGQPRLNGQVTLSAPADGTSNLQFSADLGGDFAPILPTEFQGFFGSDPSLTLRGLRYAQGGVRIDRLALNTTALKLDGSALLAASGMPQKIALQADLGTQSGAPLLLPTTGPRTFVQNGRVTARYDQAVSDEWSVDAHLTGLQRPDLNMKRAQISATGKLSTGKTLAGHIIARSEGFKPSDKALQNALGQDIQAQLAIGWSPGAPLDFSDIHVQADHVDLRGDITISQGTDRADPKLELYINGDLPDISAFSDLAKRPLAGAVSLAVQGQVHPVSGALDLSFSGDTANLGLGIPKLDPFLSGSGQTNLRVIRDETGLSVPELKIQTDMARVTGAMTLNSQEGMADVQIDLADLSPGIPELPGPASLSATVTRDSDGVIQLQHGKLSAHVIELNASSSGPNRLRLEGRMDDLSVLAPGLSGAARAAGFAELRGQDWHLDINGTGPATTSMTITGWVRGDGSDADLFLAGALPLDFANTFIRPTNISGIARYDLSLRGRPSLEALNGRISTQDARLTLPAQYIALENINGQITLDAGQAQLSMSTQAASGGVISAQGRVGLNAPYTADLSVDLTGFALTDPTLFQTSVSGVVRMSGALEGGALIAGKLTLGPTELRIPNPTGVNAQDLPGLRHIHIPAGVQRTRKYAGMIETSDQVGGSGKAFALNLNVIAPDRIFVRGRGLDAELGGTLTLTGDTTDVLPQGRFDLIRGRFDILGKRLSLTEGLVQLQGAFDPFIRFAASTKADDTTANIVIEGQASAPELTFTSTPALPQDEVLALILFGREISSISPFQAFRLAAAIRTLTGKGGEGINGRVRRGLQLDDLDVTTTEDGATEARAGKYLSENIYSEVTADTDGNSQINLNLTLNPTITARGRLTSDGETGIGVFIEKDY
jgi:translocation and assembly module TamB